VAVSTDVYDCPAARETSSQSHQLIKTKARQRSAQPDVEEEKEDYFAEKIENTEPRKLMYERPVPSAEE